MATKKTDPYTLSATVKEVSIYSPACKKVKYKPKNTVNKRLCIDSFRDPSIKEKWDQVTVTPENRRTQVFSKGVVKASNG